MLQELWWETQLVAVDVALEGSNSNESDTGRGSDAGVGESDELILMTDTSGTMGFKGGRWRDIGSNSGRGSYTGRGSGSSVG